MFDLPTKSTLPFNGVLIPTQNTLNSPSLEPSFLSTTERQHAIVGGGSIENGQMTTF